MAGAKDVLLRFLVDDKQKSKLKGIGDEAGKTQSKFSQLSGGAKLVAGGLAAMVGTKIVAFLGDATKAAMEDAAAQKQLALALQNTVGATDGQIAATENFIDVTARASGVADDELRPALAELVRTTGNLEEAQDVLGVAMDIAAAKGLPLETVTKGIGKAALGNIGALGRMGVATKNAAGETLSFEEVLAEASRTMGGAAAVAADTAEGKMRRLNVAMDEAKETIGGLLVPVMGELAESANDTAVVMGFLAEKLGLVDAAGEDAAGSMEHALETTSTFLDPVSALRTAFGFLSEKITAAKEAAVELEDPINTSAGGFRTWSDTIKTSTEALQDLTEAQDENITRLQEATSPLFALIGATDRATEAERALAAAMSEHGETSEEAFEATTNLATAELAMEAAASTFALEGGAHSIEALRELLEATDLSTAAIERYIQKVIASNNNPLRAPRVNSRGDIIGRERVSGPRAGGGPVMARQSYLVGEAGPEVVTMGSQGSVTPNHRLRNGGGGSETIIIQVDGREIARAVRNHERSLLPG